MRHVRSLRSGRTSRDVAGVPVRARPDTGSRPVAAAARVAFNWGLAHVKAVMGQREAEATYGISKEDLPPPVSWSLYSLGKDWNTAKADVVPWWGECSKEAFNTGLDKLARSPEELGRLPYRQTQGCAGGVCPVQVQAPQQGLGPVHHGRDRLRDQTRSPAATGQDQGHEDAAGLVGKVDAGTARVMSAAVRFERGRWLVSFTVAAQRPALTPASPDTVVGVDLGIRTVAVLSSGEQIPNPRHLSSALPKVRRHSRAVSRRVGPYDAATKKRRPSSSRWRRSAAALGKAAGRVADQRKDAIHKLTTVLVRELWTIVVEDLFVAGMVGNHCLARHVADASSGEIRRQLGYKTGCNGGRMVVADRWFPSSKTRSGCGAVKAKLALSERTYVCMMCPLVLDRDVNAARNLAELGEATVAGSGPETVHGRGGQGVLALPVKRQPGTAQAGNTGTALPQGRTAVRELTNAH